MTGMMTEEASVPKDVISGEMKGIVVTSQALIRTGVEESRITPRFAAATNRS